MSKEYRNKLLYLILGMLFLYFAPGVVWALYTIGYNTGVNIARLFC